MFKYESVNPGQDYDEWEAKRNHGSFDGNGRESTAFSDSTAGAQSQSHVDAGGSIGQMVAARETGNVCVCVCGVSV